MTTDLLRRPAVASQVSAEDTSTARLWEQLAARAMLEPSRLEQGHSGPHQSLGQA